MNYDRPTLDRAKLLLDEPWPENPSDRRAPLELAAATMAVSDDFFETIRTANLDWQVGQYLYYFGKAHEHSANEVIARVIRHIGSWQHGQDVFDDQVNRTA